MVTSQCTVPEKIDRTMLFLNVSLILAILCLIVAIVINVFQILNKKKVVGDGVNPDESMDSQGSAPPSQ